MTDSIEKAIADAVQTHDKIDHWECRNCGTLFDSGRDGRQHMFAEHDNPKGLRKVTA
jgi:hypothetical protein